MRKLEFVRRDELTLADRKRLRIQIASITFESPGVELYSNSSLKLGEDVWRNGIFRRGRVVR